MDDPFSPPPIGRPSACEQETRAEWITRRARMIFSAYRRDDFADPESFLLQVSMVLESYPDSVVSHVTDPRTGIQSRSKFPPVLAEIKEHCDQRLAISERLAHYATLPPPQRHQPAARIHPANVRVPAASPQYQTMRALAEERPDEARVDERGELWVPFNWAAEITASLRSWRRFSAAELQDIYRGHDAGDSHTDLPQPAGGDGPPA
jgi:hypothetical protein